MLAISSPLRKAIILRNCLLSFLFFAFTFPLAAQTTIWLENFSAGPPPPGWTTNFGTCGGGVSAVGVVGGRFEVTNQDGTTCCATGGDNENEWTTNSIDITNYCDVSISADFGGIGLFEDNYILNGPFFGCSNTPSDNGHDQIVFYYSVDGGPWTQFYYAHVGAPSGPFPTGTATISGLTGTSLRVQIKPACKASAETLWFDNVKVAGILPIINQPADITVCATQTIAATFAGSAGTTYTWTNDNTATGVAASGTGNISTVSANVTNQEVSNITVTPHIGTCPGVPKMFTVTVNPILTVDDPANVAACGGDAISVPFTGTSPTFTWTNSNAAIGLGVSGSGDLNFTAATVATTQTGTITVTPANPCPGPAQTFTITVSPQPTVNQPADVVVCGGANVSSIFTGNPVGTTFAWTNDNTAIGLGASGNGNINFSSATVTSQEVATITVTPSNGPCPGVPKTFTITINPASLVDDPSDVAVCGGDPVNVPFTGSSPTFHWTNSNPAIGLGASGNGDINFTTSIVATTQTGTITVTPTGPCPGPAQTFTITVNPQPTVNQPANIVNCGGTLITANFTGSAGTTFAWTNDNPAIGLGASGNGNISFTSATVAIQEVATITVTPSNGPCPGVPKTFTITINPPSLVDDPADAAVCGGEPVSVIFTGPSPTFHWTNSNPAIGLGASGNGNLNFNAAAVVTTQTATITVTPTGPCPGPAQTFTITVSPLPTLTQPASIGTCGGNQVIVNFAGSGATSFTWTSSNPAVGLPASSMGNINYFTPVVTNQEVTTITVTPQNGNCAGIPKVFTITLFPGSIVDTPTDESVCGSDPVSIFFTGTAPSFTWTNTNPAIGLASSGNGNINFLAANVATSQTATITVTPVGPCPGPAQTFTIMVSPRPTVNQPANVVVCGGASVTSNFTGSGSPTFSWTNSNPAIGLGASGTGNISFSSAVVATQQMATITVTPQNGNCNGVPKTFTITVNPTSTVNAPADESVCSGGQVNVLFSGTASGFNWTNNNPAIGLGASGSGNLNFTAANVATDQTATITVTPAGTCPGPAQTFDILVVAQPSVIDPANTSACANDLVEVNFSGTIGATFSWTNSNPAIGLASAGNGDLSFNAGNVATPQTGTVTVTPKLGTCTGTPQTFTITVDPLPTVSQPANLSLCSGAGIVANFSGSTGSTFNWTNSNPAIGLPASGTGNINTLSALVTSQEVATITVTPETGTCQGAARTFTITVNPAPLVNTTSDLSACGGQTVNVPLAGPGSPILNWTNSNVAIGLAASGSGPINFVAANLASPQTGNIIVTPSGGACPGIPDTFNINVVTAPVVNQPANVMACGGASVNIPFNGTAGAVFSWINSNPAIGLPASGNGSLNFPANNVSGQQTATITITPGLGLCTGTPVTFTITLNPTPTAAISGVQTVCNGHSTTLTASGGTIYLWNTGDVTASATVMPTATTTYSVIVSTDEGCSASATAIVTVNNTSGTTLLKTSCDPAQVGTTTQTLMNQLGCDSIVTIITTLLPSSTTNLTKKTCNPANAGTFTQVLMNQLGCDSTIITVVTYDPTALDTTILAKTSCDPSQVGTVQNLLTGADGCDSLVIINTTLLPSTTINLAKKTCNPANAGTFTQTLTNQFGCDSTIVTVVTYDPSAIDTTILAKMSCDPTQVGTVQTLLTGADGCDSLVIINTTLLPSTTTNLTQKTCNPANAGTFTQVLTNQFGCDSTIVTIVSYDPSAIDTTILAKTSCDPTQVGTVQNLLTGVDGCDSLVIINTTLLPSTITNLTKKTCNPNNVGTFTQMLTNQFGCDSTIITMVTFDAMAVDSTIISKTSCNPAQVGSTQTLLTGADGCDSLVIINTTLLPSTVTNLTQKTCNPNNVGTFTQMLTNQFGCDSTIITVVTFDPMAVDTTILTLTTCNPNQVGSTQILLTGVDGCDSLVITNTIIDPVLCGTTALVSATGVSCPNNKDGQASISVSAGQTPLVYQWKDGSGNTGTGQITSLNTPTLVIGLAPGIFSVTVTPAIGTSTVLTATITAPPPMVLQANAVLAFNGLPLSCAGSSDGSVQTTITGGTAPYNFLWANGANTPNLSNLAAGNYLVTVTDQNGCTVQASTLLTAPEPVKMALQLASADCGDAFANAVVTASGGTGDYTASVDGVLASDLTVPIATGTHVVQVMDENGCTADTTLKISLPPVPTLSLPADTTVQLGQSLTIEAITNLNAWKSLVWQPGAPDTGCVNCLTQTWLPINSQRYSLTIVDSFGCAATATMRVIVGREIAIYVPNVFSPDGDGYNDIFQIGVGPSIQNLSVFRIFDRWGEMVYNWDETIPANMWPGWDGRVGGTKAEVGVYVYYLKVSLIDGTTRILSGDLTIAKR